MPPTTRGSAHTPFIALWVEDGKAQLWRVGPDGGIDEIARFATEGMNRPTVLEISAQFVRAASRRVNIGDLYLAPTNEARIAEGKPPLGRPRKGRVPKREGGKSRYTPRADQIARQTELYEALQRHPEGVQSQVLAVELGRNEQGGGVALANLARSGRARHDKETRLWYPVNNNGDAPE